ncbi:hypothetical protein [Fimbriiglobus ruber]|nr:hypothetical protein [Fimbriiglobus ruber]
MTTTCRSFDQARYIGNCQGYPCLAAVSQNEVIVGDWSGNLVRVRLSPFAVMKTVFAAGRILGSTPVNNIFRSLSPAPDDPGRCAVATSGAHAVVWDGESGTVRHVAPEAGPVHSVAWLGSGHLLLGTGDYSLGAGAEKWPEVWHLDGDEPSCVERVALPGTCVDAIAVTEDGQRQILAFSGLRSQDRGFVSVLNAASLLPISVFDLPFAMAGRVECTEELILVSNAGAVRAISREDGGEKWCHETVSESTDFAYDADSHQLLISNCELISAGRGRVVATWPVLDGCSCVRPRPEGGFVGVSKSGMIGVWDVEP